MLDVGVLLEYICPLNACYIHFCNAHKCKGVSLKYVLFNVTRLHKSSRPILDSVSHWNPVSAMEGNQTPKTTIALLLQVLADMPSSLTSWREPQLFFQPGMESLRGAQELEGQLLTARIKHSWNTSVSPHQWLGIVLAFGLVRALDLRDNLSNIFSFSESPKSYGCSLIYPHAQMRVWIGRDFLDMHSPAKNQSQNTAIFHFCTTFDEEFLVKRRVEEIYTDLVSIALFSSIQMVMWLCLGELWGEDQNACFNE